LILKLHRRAEAEIREAATWYGARAEALDRRFLQAIREVFESLESDPQRFAKLETTPDEAPFRRALLEGFPYIEPIPNPPPRP